MLFVYWLVLVVVFVVVVVVSCELLVASWCGKIVGCLSWWVGWSFFLLSLIGFMANMVVVTVVICLAVFCYFFSWSVGRLVAWFRCYSRMFAILLLFLLLLLLLLWSLVFCLLFVCC